MEDFVFRDSYFGIVSKCVLALTLPAPSCTSDSAAMAYVDIS